jgi:hypothetical protein
LIPERVDRIGENRPADLDQRLAIRAGAGDFNGRGQIASFGVSGDSKVVNFSFPFEFE